MVSFKELWKDFEELKRITPASIALVTLVIVSIFYVVRSLFQW